MSIISGDLRAGERLPSLRRTARLYGVSMPTVMKAYRLLEAKRLVTARQKSGFFVLQQLARYSELVADVVVSADKHFEQALRV